MIKKTLKKRAKLKTPNVRKPAAKKTAPKPPKQFKSASDYYPALDSLLRALTGYYADDRLAPGVVLAALRDGRYYGSIARYVPTGAATTYADGVTGVKRIVSHKIIRDSPDQVISELGRSWYEKTVAPMERLQKDFKLIKGGKNAPS